MLAKVLDPLVEYSIDAIYIGSDYCWSVSEANLGKGRGVFRGGGCWSNPLPFLGNFFNFLGFFKKKT